MVKEVIIFAKKNAKVLFSSIIGEQESNSKDNPQILEKLKATASSLREGFLITQLNIGNTLVMQGNNVTTAVIFDKEMDEEEIIINWKNAAKEIGALCSRNYDKENNQLINIDNLEVSLTELIDSYLEEANPISKMRDAFW
ncbi:MAG: hypothetical protein U9O98_04640 [Asgard group archaeon]|nr:hypothetical protein [Asgard group archaeon]